MVQVRRYSAAAPALAVLLGGCSDEAPGLDPLDGGTNDARTTDTEPRPDAAIVSDAGPADAEAPDAGPVCTPDPRPEEGYPALDLGLRCWVIRPGERLDFELGWARCCYFLDPYAGCETWSVEGEPGGITIDANGTVTASADADPGTTFRVVATLPDGARATTEVTVITDDSHPLQGRYGESERVGCETGARFVPQIPIRELNLCGDRFQATYIPFEVYVDFWGTIELDPGTGALTLGYEGGNTSEDGLDLSGQARLEGDEFILEDMRLQIPAEGELEGCGHIFRRR